MGDEYYKRTDPEKFELNELRRLVGTNLLKYALDVFKGYELYGDPEELFNIWFGVSKTLIEMLLTNIHEYNINKFETVKSKILNQLESLKKSVEQNTSRTSGMYG